MASGAFFSLCSFPNHTALPVRAGAGVQRNKLKAGSRLGRAFAFFAGSGNSLQHGCHISDSMKGRLAQAP
jgi:hypothetical protein